MRNSPEDRERLERRARRGDRAAAVRLDKDGEVAASRALLEAWPAGRRRGSIKAADLLTYAEAKAAIRAWFVALGWRPKAVGNFDQLEGALPEGFPAERDLSWQPIPFGALLSPDHRHWMVLGGQTRAVYGQTWDEEGGRWGLPDQSHPAGSGKNAKILVVELLERAERVGVAADFSSPARAAKPLVAPHLAFLSGDRVEFDRYDGEVVRGEFLRYVDRGRRADIRIDDGNGESVSVRAGMVRKIDPMRSNPSEDAERLARQIARGDRSRITAQRYLDAVGGPPEDDSGPSPYRQEGQIPFTFDGEAWTIDMELRPGTSSLGRDYFPVFFSVRHAGMREVGSGFAEFRLDGTRRSQNPIGGWHWLPESPALANEVVRVLYGDAVYAEAVRLAARLRASGRRNPPDAEGLARRIARGDRSCASARAYADAICASAAPATPPAPVSQRVADIGAFSGWTIRGEPVDNPDGSITVDFEVFMPSLDGNVLVGNGTVEYPSAQWTESNLGDHADVSWGELLCHCSTAADSRCLVHGEDPVTNEAGLERLRLRIEDMVRGDEHDNEGGFYMAVWHGYWERHERDGPRS